MFVKLYSVEKNVVHIFMHMKKDNGCFMRDFHVTLLLDIKYMLPNTINQIARGRVAASQDSLTDNDDMLC